MPSMFVLFLFAFSIQRQACLKPRVQLLVRGGLVVTNSTKTRQLEFGGAAARDAMIDPALSPGEEKDCPICCYDYDDDAHSPEKFECSHAICKACLNRYQFYGKKLDGGIVQFPCPLCRATQQVQRTNAVPAEFSALYQNYSQAKKLQRDCVLEMLQGDHDKLLRFDLPAKLRKQLGPENKGLASAKKTIVDFLPTVLYKKINPVIDQIIEDRGFRPPIPREKKHLENIMLSFGLEEGAKMVDGIVENWVEKDPIQANSEKRQEEEKKAREHYEKQQKQKEEQTRKRALEAQVVKPVKKKGGRFPFLSCLRMDKDAVRE